MRKTLISSILLISITWLISGCSATNGTITATKKAPTRVTNFLTRDIEKKLNHCKELEGSNIYAEVAPNGILLTGTTITEKQKYLASAIANSLVKKGTVINRIAVIKPKAKQTIPMKTKK
ncbi:MAG: hypothetical protein JXQ77_03015 [Campylobacterales bacterium]|nr:hypothetical protein [Campylobacterales bacterium]